ncbi:MAG: ribosomal protein S18-alanine N-acetyltransferase [Deltaproteobacteria bacterium]|nr:ribosomal protein S18-alanine N-acetyltransferase [Deltaproteobacteria bacterium]
MEKPQEPALPCGFSVSAGSLSFREMDPSDIDEVLSIERSSFSYPWSVEFFLQETRVPCARSLLGVLDGKTIGYIIYWVLPYEVDIHNLAVAPAYRRKGFGRSLLQTVVEDARKRGVSRVTLEVRKSNEAAQCLYASLGFTSCGVRQGYYSDNNEDALIMVLDLGV